MFWSWSVLFSSQVANIRSSGKYLTDVDESTRKARTDELSSLDFEWKLRMSRKKIVSLYRSNDLVLHT
jgi:hypothetical protein